MVCTEPSSSDLCHREVPSNKTLDVPIRGFCLRDNAARGWRHASTDSCAD